MQATITLGDTLSYTTAVPDYPATDGWVLRTRLVPRVSGAGSAIDLLSTADADDTSLHRTTAAASVTATWQAADYSWHAWVELSGESYEVEHGQITLLPDPRTATSLDNRSPAEQALDAVTAALQGRATSVQKGYRIGDREVQFYEASELVALRSKLVIEVKRERRATALAKGLADPSKTFVRMSSNA